MEDALKAYVDDSNIAKRFIDECCEFKHLQQGERAKWHLPLGKN
jgi:hypothetical protein